MDRHRMMLAILADELATEPLDGLLGASDLRAACVLAVVRMDGSQSRVEQDAAVARLRDEVRMAYRDAGYGAHVGRYYVDGLCDVINSLGMRRARW